MFDLLGRRPGLFICRGEVLAMHTRQRRDQIKLRDEEADQLAPVSQRHH